MSEIIELLHKGVGLYEKLVGATREDVNGKMKAINIDHLHQLKSLDEALTLDPTGVTSTLLLRSYTETEVASRSFNWLDLLRKPELAKQLDLPREIISVIESPLISDSFEHFQSQLAKALIAYNAYDREDVRKLLDSPDEMAFLRRDALRSMNQLRVDQFLDGENDPESTVPVYTKTVHQWWNVNSMIEHLTRLPSGVSLNLVREPDGYSSYFVFAIRNGGRLFTLSDIEPECHPLQNMIARRPDRKLERRIARNWFPYELLNINYDDEGRKLYFETVSKCKDLAVRQNNVIPLKLIADLEPESLIWTVMMLDLIIERFWNQEYRAPELSYTGEMIQEEAILLTSAAKAGLPVKSYKGVGLTPITKESILSTTPEIENALGKCPAKQHQWMLDRYGNQCADEALNLLSTPSDIFIIDESKTEPAKKVKSADLSSLTSSERENVNNSRLRLHQLRSTSFGTKDQLNSDRIWLARYNMAKQIQHTADKEFNERKDEVLAWYQDRVTANLPALLSLVGHNRLWRKFDFEMGFGDHHTVPHGGSYSCKETNRTWSSVMTMVSREVYKSQGVYRKGWVDGFPLPSTQAAEPLCAFTGAKPFYMTTFYPSTPEDIAFFAGCSISELPDVLQHFYGIELYTGNYLLNRIDPAATELRNPWVKLDLRFRIGLSKRGLKKAIEAKDNSIIEAYWRDEDMEASMASIQKRMTI